MKKSLKKGEIMKIEGLKELERKLNKLSSAAKNDAKQEALHAGSVLIHGQATLNAPVDTGYLRSSIDFEVGSEDADIFATADYAAKLEYGGSGQAAQPYLRPALDSNRSNLIKIFSKTYAKHLKK